MSKSEDDFGFEVPDDAVSDQDFCGDSAGESLTEDERELFKFIAGAAEVARRKAIMEIVVTILNSSNVHLSALGLMRAANLADQTGYSISEWARQFEVSRAAIYLASKQWEQVLELSPSDSVNFCSLARRLGVMRGQRAKIANFWREFLALPGEIRGLKGAKDVGLQRGSKKASKTKCGGGCRAGAAVPKNKKI